MSFYPTEPIPLRAKLKEKIEDELGRGRWPWWFTVPPELNYQAKRRWLAAQYDTFISRRPTSRRMPIALYYKALLGEAENMAAERLTLLGNKQKQEDRFFSLFQKPADSAMTVFKLNELQIK